MNEEFFPIGTIVKLNGFDKKVMITGFYQKIQNKIFDYCGVEYPLGISNENKYLYFDMNDINRIIKIGFLDLESIKLISYLKKLIKKKY